MRRTRNLRRGGWLWPSLITAAVIAALGVFTAVRWPARDAAPRHARLSLELPAGLTLRSDFSAPFAIAPNGSAVVLEAAGTATDRLYVRQLTDPALRALTGTEGARQPFFSTDGAWVGFFASRKFAKVPIGGGPVVQLADIGGNPRGAAWAPDGTIVVAPTQTSGLVRIPDGGGRPIPLTTLDKVRGEYSHRWPDVLPGGAWVLFTVGFEDASFDEARIDAVSIATGERRVLVSGAGFARHLPGRLLFVRGGHLHAVGLDPERLAVSGTPEVVFDAVRYDWRNGGAHLAVSASGGLLYAPGEPTSSDFYLAWVDRDGRLTRTGTTPRPFRDIKASPDGRRIATVIRTTTEADLWVVDATGTLSRLSFALAAPAHLDGQWKRRHGRRREERYRAAPHHCCRWQTRSGGPAREPESALSERVVAGWTASSVSGEPARHRLGSSHSRRRCLRTSGQRAADLGQYPVS